MKNVRRFVILLVLGGICAAIYQAMQPQPVKVDLAAVQRDSLRVTIDEDGKTRIKERYVVSTPLAGRLLRVDIDPGDPVAAGSLPIAVIEPNDPQLLNPRELAAAEALERAAEAKLQRAAPLVASARAELDFAESELARQRELRRSGATTTTGVQDAERRYRTTTQAFRAASFAADIARFELEQAKAALMPSRTAPGSNSEPTWRFDVCSPIAGKVLRVFQESSAVVTPGTPLLEVGDPTDLELEIDVLSSDAVQIQPGDDVVIEHWGGDHPLHGSVRLVEPSAFTKVSALGVEEQRVNVIIDLTDPVEKRPTLGDGFRVEVKIVVWEGPDVLQVPISALFREDDDWLVFRKDGDRAASQIVEVGHRNKVAAEILSGLDEDDQVIVHHSDQITDQVLIEPRD